MQSSSRHPTNRTGSESQPYLTTTGSLRCLSGGITVAAVKVAYLFSRYPVPSQTFCDTEMRALEAAGLEVEIFSCSPPTTSFRHGAAERPRQAPVFYAPTGAALEWVELAARRDGRWPAAMLADHEARYGARYEPTRRARHAVYFAGLLQRRGIEHLHVHFANRATHAALFIQALTGLPFSFTAHAQDFLVDLGNDDLLGEMCARAAFVVTVSEWSRRALIERCPAVAPKIHRVYNGLPLDRWPAPNPASSKPATFILSIGRLVAFKGFDDLVQACAGLKARGVAFRCEIAGEGPLRDALAQRIDALGLMNQIELTGLLPQAEIRARLAACDVFALACRVDEKGACDVLPTVVLEAMAAGRPVVSTTLAGVPEIVADGQTGRLVAPGDVAALTDALEELCHDPSTRETFGQAGRRRVEADFSSSVNVRELAALFDGSRRETAPSIPAQVARTVCLFDFWPTGDADLDGALRAWRADDPGLRLAALNAGVAPENPDAVAMVSACEFLPDAMVLEAEWRERFADAHRIEEWRGKFGGGSGETDEFLLAARRALYLSRCWHGGAMGHLHALGPQGWRCALILKWLGAVRSVSCFLAQGDLPGSMRRRLADQFSGEYAAGEPANWHQWATWVRSPR